MHSKVIIASLVFGLSIGFAAVASTNAKATASKEDETAYKLQKQEKGPEKEAAIIDPSILQEVDRPLARAATTYTYVNDAYHRNSSTSSLQEHVFDSYYPNGHGHNDMCHCSLCDTNVWMTALETGNSYSDSVVASSAKWYYFCPIETGYYMFETTGSYDTYGELYLGNYPTTRTTYNDDGGVNRNFRIYRYLTAYQNVFLRVRGYSWRAVSYSLSVTRHYHNYSQYSQYDGSSHKVSCACGSYYYQAHSYTTCTFSNNAFHTMKCVCGRQLQTEHEFDYYYPYGHGHNDMIHCSTCDNNIECFRLQENYTYNHSFEVSNAIWYIFIPQRSGTYVFETTGNYDTYGELFLGDCPSTRTTYADNGGTGYNFRLSYYLECGQPAFLRVRENDWEAASYSISVTEDVSAPAMDAWTIMFYMCGSTLESGGGNNCSGNISGAISNILSIPNKPSNVNILIEAGGCTDWCGYNIPDNRNTRYTVNNGQLCQDTTGLMYDRDASMGAEATFESFLRWGLTCYPAQKTGVVLMNHGGAMYGVCFDTVHDDDSLTNSEVRQALRNVLGNNPTEKLEFIQYDACLMAVQDVAKTNAEFFKYMVASEDEITETMVSGVSAQWLAGVYSGQETCTFLETMINNFVPNSCGWEQTSTILDLSKMSNYFNAFESFANALSSTIRNQNDVQSLLSMASSIYFPVCPNGGANMERYRLVDAYTFLNTLKDEWYNASYITPYINSVLSYFPSESEYAINWSSNLPRQARSNGLVKYHAASLGRAGSGPVTHGLTIHLGYYDYDNEQYFSSAETDFNNWYNIFVDQSKLDKIKDGFASRQSVFFFSYKLTYSISSTIF